MTELMSKPILPGDRRTLPAFQEGILRNNKALDMLYQDMIKYNMTYIVTYRLSRRNFKRFLKETFKPICFKFKTIGNIFKEKNKKTTSFDPKHQHTMILDSAHVDLPLEVKNFFFKCRINFRIRDLNKRSKVMKAKQRIMRGKKLIKINL